MKRTLIGISTLLLVTSCHLGYGPLQDQSKFVSARLADDKRTVLFSFHRFAYRAATGWRAFPDGGIPKYATDINLLGTCDLQTRKIKILRREKNSQWQPGSGLFTIHSANGTKALISQGGQLRGPFKLGVKFVLLDFQRGDATDVDLKSDLAQRGRDTGQIYLVDGEGTLVFVTLSLEEAKDPGAYRNSTAVPEIWARTSGGEYVKAAVSAHYQCTRNGEVLGAFNPRLHGFFHRQPHDKDGNRIQSTRLRGRHARCHPVFRPEGTRIRRQSQWPMEIPAA
jgi:hypothetical protein